MIVRMFNNCGNIDLEGFLYNVYGASVALRLRQDDEYGLELEFDLVALDKEYPGCVSEALACLIGAIVVGVDEPQIEHVLSDNEEEQRLMESIIAEDWVNPETGDDWRRYWIRACEWMNEAK